jgi:curved DNA-binding protein CbpA
MPLREGEAVPADHPQGPSLYDVLQVRADSSTTDIARAYRRLARAWHPDTRPADPGAAARFQAVSDAYELLSDPVRRAAYDERRAVRASGSKTVSRPAADRGHRSSPTSPLLSSPSLPPLWPLGPARTAPLASQPRVAAGGPVVRPGPVRIGPPPGDPAAVQASAEARLLALARFVRSCLGDDRNWPW